MCCSPNWVSNVKKAILFNLCLRTSLCTLFVPRSLDRLRKQMVKNIFDFFPSTMTDWTSLIEVAIKEITYLESPVLMEYLITLCLCVFWGRFSASALVAFVCLHYIIKFVIERDLIFTKLNFWPRVSGENNWKLKLIWGGKYCFIALSWPKIQSCLSERT